MVIAAEFCGGADAAKISIGKRAGFCEEVADGAAFSKTVRSGFGDGAGDGDFDEVII